jgi:hypothetical protein
MKKISIILALLFFVCLMLSFLINELLNDGSALQWLAAITTFLASVGIPLVVFFVGEKLSISLKNRDINTHYLDFAVQILNADPYNAGDLREWAKEIINKYSQVPMTEEAANQLRNFRFKPASSNKTAE